MQGLKISKMQVIDNPKEDAQIPIVQNGTNYSMPFGTLNKLITQIYEDYDIPNALQQLQIQIDSADAATAKAKDTATHPGYVDNDGYYYKWNVETKTYENTDVNLKGEKGDTFTFNDLTDDQVQALMAPAIDAAAKATTAKQNADAAANACNTATNAANTAASTATDATNTAINSIMMYDCSAKGTITFATLDLAIAAVPLAYQKGGLHIKFVDTASNKYNTYFLTTPTWSTSTADWQYSNENIEYAKNGTGVTVPKGKVVYINSSTGDNPLFLLATNTDYNIAARTWGMTYDGINADAVGRVIHFGLIENLDTSAYTAGTELWLGVNGEFTNVRPTLPTAQIYIGMVIRSSATEGSIFIDLRVVVDASIQDVYKKSNYNDGDNIIDFNTIHLITDNPEFICVAIDTDNKILYGIKADGQPYFGVGCPQQVKDYVNEQINKILGTDDITTTIDSLKEIESFLKDFTNSDTLKKLFDLKANVDEVKATTDDIYKKSNPNDSKGNVVDTNTIVSVEENPEYIKVITDNVGKLIEAIGLDGIRKFFDGIEVQGTLQCVTDNPEYITVWLDNQERIVFGFKINGDPYFGYGIPSQISYVIESLKSNTKTRIDTLQQSIDNNILALDFNSDTGELYSLTGEMSTINASMEDNGDVYLEQEII